MIVKILYKKLKIFIAAEKAFFKNVSFIFGGKVYVAILSLILTPIIARLFEPKDYGEFALYNTVVQNLVVVGTLSLPLAVSTVKKGDLDNLLKLNLSIILSFTVLFTISLFLLNQYLDTLFSTIVFSKYWLIVLLGFIITSLVTSLNAVNIGLQRFKTNTQIGIIEGSSTKAFNLGSGWIGLNSLGLILSDVASKTISLLLLIKKLPKETKLSLAGLSKTKKLLFQYKQFPTYVMPSQWIGMLNNQFLIIIVALLFSKNELGQLVMAIGLLGIPLHLVTNAFQPVITERLSSLKGNAERKIFFRNTALLLFLVSLVLFSFILVLPPDTFTFILGSKWEGIKPIINVLAIFYIFLLIDKSFENGFIVFNKQKSVLYFCIVELFFQIAIVISINIFKLPLMTTLVLIAIMRGLASVIRVLYLWQG